MSDIHISVVLQLKDWNRDLGGWRLDALRIPGCTVRRVAVAGTPLTDGGYQVQGDRLLLTSKPTRAVGVDLAVPGDLTLQAKELALKTTQEQNQSRHNKRQLLVSVILGVLTTTGGIITTYLVTKKPVAGDSSPSEDELRECRTGLERMLVLMNRPEQTLESMRTLMSNEAGKCVRTLDTRKSE